MASKRAHTIETGTDNVYADLGDPDAEAMLFKAQLTRSIGTIISKRKLKHQEAASIVGMSEGALWLILRGHFRGVSEDKLLNCAHHLGADNHAGDAGGESITTAIARESLTYNARDANCRAC